MFPADAGMNRKKLYIECTESDVPRGRGDEPLPMIEHKTNTICSPRTRG